MRSKHIANKGKTDHQELNDRQSRQDKTALNQNLKESSLNSPYLPSELRKALEKSLGRNSSVNNNPNRKTLAEGQVIENKILPFKIDPVPQFDCNVFVYNHNGDLGFTASQVSTAVKITPAEIKQVWDQQLIQQLFRSAIAAEEVEEELFLGLGVIIVVQRTALKQIISKNKVSSQDVWNTTVWEFNRGAFRAVKQFISKQEPTPGLIKQAGKEEQKIFLLSENQALLPDPESSTFKLIDLDQYQPEEIKRLYLKEDANTAALQEVA